LNECIGLYFQCLVNLKYGNDNGGKINANSTSSCVKLFDRSFGEEACPEVGIIVSQNQRMAHAYYRRTMLAVKSLE